MATEPEPQHAAYVVVDRIALDAGGDAALVSLNRPEQLNPIDWTTVHQLQEILTAVDDDPAVRAVLIIGRGRAFSAGGDLKSYVKLQEDSVAFPAFLDDLHRTFQFIATMRKPVIALVNGVTVAGGLELILSCDFALAADTAKIGDGHLTFGQMGGGGVLSMLPRAIGPAKARELVLTGRWLSAEEAVEWGLISRVVAPGDLLSAGIEVANAIAERSPLAVANAKLVMNSGWAQGNGLEAALALERERNAYYCLTSEDAREGLRAFQEKRKPRYRGV